MTRPQPVGQEGAAEALIGRRRRPGVDDRRAWRQRHGPKGLVLATGPFKADWEKAQRIAAEYNAKDTDD